MKVNRFLIFGILFLGNAYAEEPPYGLLSQKIQHAEEAFSATLYEQAIVQYSYLLSELDGEPALSVDKKSSLKFVLASRLAEAYFFQGDFLAAYPYFQLATHLNKSQKEASFNSEWIYFYVQCCRYLKKYAEALEFLASYNEKSALSSKLSYELGLNYLLSGKLANAEKEFLKLKEKSTDSLLTLAKLQLARIAMLEGNINQAQEIAAQIASDDSQNRALEFEIEYLKGEVAFYSGRYDAAIEHLKKALPKQHQNKACWRDEAFYLLSWCHLMAANLLQEPELKSKHYMEAETYLSMLIDGGSIPKNNVDASFLEKERYYLTLAQCYLAKAISFNDQEACKKAESLLVRYDRFSPHLQPYALLLRSEATVCGSSFDAENAIDDKKLLFMQAANGFGTLYNQLKGQDAKKASTAFKHQIKSLQMCGSQESLKSAMSLLNDFLENYSKGELDSKNLEEILYLFGLIVSHAAENDPNEALVEKAQKIINSALLNFPTGKYSDACLRLLAIFHLRQEKYQEAESAFLALADHCPGSTFADEALYWCAYCAEKLKKDPNLIHSYRLRLLESYPHSSFAPPTNFLLFTYRHYLQGDRAAIKHLEDFVIQYEEHPLTITAYYLLGLDYKRERRSIEGRSLRKKNLIKAIELFYKSENRLETLFSQQRMDGDEGQFIMIRYCALLERALANQAIADESPGIKRAIYSQYAQELLLQIHSEIEDLTHPLGSLLRSSLSKEGEFSPFHQECLYHLLKNQVKSGHIKAAIRTIDLLLAKYAKHQITHAYYLAKAYYEKGAIALHKGDYQEAINFFEKSEECDQGKYMSVDEKLDLWIQQSVCYKSLHQTDQAMLILSKVINHNAISNLRVKAMYLRAEIYAMQGRHELARKQLEATARKGGEWAGKAKTKLDEDYGY